MIPDAKGLGEPGACGGPSDGMPSLNIFRVGGVARTRRILDGKACDVGVAGSTLTEWCGECPRWSGVLDIEVENEAAELVDDALECE